jgi:hypothetical protein
MAHGGGTGRRFGISASRPRLVAVLAVLAVLAPACSAPSGPGPIAQQAGVWRSDGYGWIFAIDGGQLKTYETTTISCIPGRELEQISTPGADGAVEYGRDNVVATHSLRRGPDGAATLHLWGTAADVDLIPLPAVAPECARQLPDDPVTTFDVFWATFAENYNSFPRKNIDPDALRDRYRSDVSADTDPEELVGIFQQMLRPLGDAHTSITGGGRYFSGERPGTNQASSDDISAAVDDHLRLDLGVTAIETFAGDQIAYADLPEGRGYLRITGFDDYSEKDSSFQASSAELKRVLDTVFTQARVDSWRGLVIDVRDNTGGDDALALQVAARLTDTPYTAYSKQARNDPVDPTRYGRLQTVTVTPADSPRYTGPLRVLTSDLTISAGETFVQAVMGRSPEPSRVGTPTQGVFGDVLECQLPNGWKVGLGNEDYYGPDGRNYEGIGIPPTITTPVFTPEELALHRDSALDTPW